MGKTANGAVWLDKELLSAYDFWQYWRNVNDADVIKLMYLFTDLEIDEIKKMEGVQGQEINDLKRLLADEITSIVHGRHSLDEIHKSAAGIFTKNMSDLSNMQSIPKYNLTDLSKSAIDVLVESGLCESRGDAKRLLRGGGVYVDGCAISEDYKFHKENFKNGFVKFSCGKKKHILIVIE